MILVRNLLRWKKVMFKINLVLSPYYIILCWSKLNDCFILKYFNEKKQQCKGKQLK